MLMKGCRLKWQNECMQIGRRWWQYLHCFSEGLPIMEVLQCTSWREHQLWRVLRNLGWRISWINDGSFKWKAKRGWIHEILIPNAVYCELVDESFVFVWFSLYALLAVFKFYAFDWIRESAFEWFDLIEHLSDVPLFISGKWGLTFLEVSFEFEF